MESSVNVNVGDRILNIQSGKIAKQASGSALVQYGGSVVLVTVVSNTESKITDFLPLSVEYQEKIYSAGRIPGNYFRREVGRPSEKEILTARLIDRPTRPLFPKYYPYETQIIATVLSMDKQNDPDILAMIGASAALSVSDVPFDGPIASVRIGRIKDEYIINPRIDQIKFCDMNIIVAGSKTGIVMVEGECDVVSEKDLLNAIFFGHEAIKPIIDIQEKLSSSVGKKKRLLSIPSENEILLENLENIAFDRLKKAMLCPSKIDRKFAIKKVELEILDELGEEWIDSKKEIIEILKKFQKKICRNLILDEGIRLDNRNFDEVRPISCEIGVLPYPHGSSLFTRGETQVLGVLTLGSSQDEQRLETLNGEEHRSFMLHYNFPPFSVGEVKRVGSPSRRDIGHGGLAMKALEKIIPKKNIFDYTIRIVSEVLESNGSSSMATVCAATLAMMDGGVPIEEPVAGIAMGLFQEGDRAEILTDILGDEDHAGDMDFKVAGTAKGITAIQMDIKISELSKNIIEDALEQARLGRLEILEKMLNVISFPKEDISPYAPRIITMEVSPNKIRDIIGPGGKVIRSLQSSTNTKIEISDSGLIKIAGASYEEVDAAKLRINDLAIDPEIGKIYTGKIVKITDFGAFVQLAPGIDGLLHISQLANYRVAKVTDVVKLGDDVRVKVLEISKDKKIRLNLKSVLK